MPPLYYILLWAYDIWPYGHMVIWHMGIYGHKYINSMTSGFWKGKSHQKWRGHAPYLIIRSGPCSHMGIWHVVWAYGMWSFGHMGICYRHMVIWAYIYSYVPRESLGNGQFDHMPGIWIHMLQAGAAPGLKLNQSLLYKAGHIAPESRVAAADISMVYIYIYIFPISK